MQCEEMEWDKNVNAYAILECTFQDSMGFINLIEVYA